MTPLIVIQARLGSKRLPGKVLMDLGGKPVLQHVVERCQRTGYPVVVATTATDGPQMAGKTGGVWLAGAGGAIADADVLSRYADIPERADDILGFTPSILVRITADCPLVDPRLIEAAVQAVKSGFPYAGNTVERHWPRGLDVEAFTTDLLLRAHREAVSPYDREHVTPWMQRNALGYALPASVLPLGAPNSWRWCLDEAADYDWLQRLWWLFPDHPNGPTPEEVAAVVSIGRIEPRVDSPQNVD